MTDYRTQQQRLFGIALCIAAVIFDIIAYIALSIKGYV